MILTLVAAVVVFALSAGVCLWLINKRGNGLLSNAFAVICGVQAFCSLVLMLYIGFYWLLPSGSSSASYPGFEGVSLSRIEQWGHASFVAHVAKVDLARFEAVISPPDSSDSLNRYKAMRTSRALELYGGTLAVNASFFRPFRDKHLFDYYPHSGDRVEAIGKTVFNGAEFGAHGSDWPVLALFDSGIEDVDVKIGALDDVYIPGEPNPPKMMVSGKSLLVKEGLSVAVSDGAPYPRTAVGIDQQGHYLWLIVVDGKQPGYSKGIGLEALANIMVELGVYDGIELDGGGSATMAVARDTGVEVISRPSHTNLPARERPVANHLIVKPR